MIECLARVHAYSLEVCEYSQEEEDDAWERMKAASRRAAPRGKPVPAAAAKAVRSDPSMRSIGLGLRNRKDVPYKKLAAAELPDDEDDEEEEVAPKRKSAPKKAAAAPSTCITRTHFPHHPRALAASACHASPLTYTLAYHLSHARRDHSSCVLMSIDVCVQKSARQLQQTRKTRTRTPTARAAAAAAAKMTTTMTIRRRTTATRNPTVTIATPAAAATRPLPLISTSLSSRTPSPTRRYVCMHACLCVFYVCVFVRVVVSNDVAVVNFAAITRCAPLYALKCVYILCTNCVCEHVILHVWRSVIILLYSFEHWLACVCVFLCVHALSLLRGSTDDGKVNLVSMILKVIIFPYYHSAETRSRHPQSKHAWVRACVILVFH